MMMFKTVSGVLFGSPPIFIITNSKVLSYLSPSHYTPHNNAIL